MLTPMPVDDHDEYVECGPKIRYVNATILNHMNIVVYDVGSGGRWAVQVLYHRPTHENELCHWFWSTTDDLPTIIAEVLGRG